MEQEEYLDKLKETYQEGFRDGFEYGSGKRSPYFSDTLNAEESKDAEEAG
jgi:hypothetical protein